MPQKHHFTIKDDSTRVEAIPAGESAWEYRVGTGVTFSLILTSQKNITAQARVTVRLTGRGAKVIITGIFIAAGETKLTLHTMQVHAAPDTTSDLLVKTVLSDHARCLYDGGIRVEKKAQKTDAYQRNENLLLSGHAYAESKPSLEILANDVRCTHGATAGPIDPEQIWYLATRGVSPARAASLIAQGFIASALVRIEDEKIRGDLQQHLIVGV